MDESLRRLCLGLIVGVIAFNVGLFIGVRWEAMGTLHICGTITTGGTL
ncbi:hypothetical protein [Saccharibacter floricola]|nr:hypothetical protein [Saccharibacter floricola]